MIALKAIAVSDHFRNVTGNCGYMNVTDNKKIIIWQNLVNLNY
jgi:hypothetical protein